MKVTHKGNINEGDVIIRMTPRQLINLMLKQREYKIKELMING